MTITKDITFAEALQVKGAGKILAKFNFPCLHCPIAKIEMDISTLEQVCNTYGIDLNILLKE